MMTTFRFFASTIVFLSLTSFASAQIGGTRTGGTTGTSGTSGMTGSSGIGGTSGLGGTTGSTSATGQSSTGSSTGAQTGTGAATPPSGGTEQSNAAQTFIGANATQGFIGGSSQATNQQGNNRQFQAIQNKQSQQSTSQQTGTPRAIKTALRVGFAFPTASQSQIAGRLANANVASLGRFTPARPELAGIDVELNSDGIAVLTGSAPTVETKRLAANLMRLQPGIRKVDNQIVVQAN